MAGKKVKSEVEGIRNELQNLSEAVWALREHVTIQTAAAAAASSSSKHHKGKSAEPAVSDLNVARETRGTVVTRGVVRNADGDREYRWDIEATVDTLMTVDDDRAARLLAAIGHRQRLAILKMLLDRPTTAADLVGTLDLGTTGAAYHHLNVLQSADLVTQEGRGVFVIQSHRVSALFTMFAGIESAASLTVTEPADGDGDGDGDQAKGDDGDGDGDRAKDDDRGKRKKRKPA
ncbi:MAG: helix-turn-helix domain-containing protein [Chloroflexota bacterium]|nr:helix-turn-helix domain-containing protein [Chloroflexota bacterium]